MTNKKMDSIFKEKTEILEGGLGYWTLVYEEQPLIVVTDEAANRMRIFTPIIEQKYLEEGQQDQMLEANFHSALDAKYAVYNGFVISVFTHPLKELRKNQLIDALSQVANLATTFGTTYSSTDLIFGGQVQEEKRTPLSRKEELPKKHVKKI